MAVLMPEGKQSFSNSAGAPLIGGKLYTYDAGTSNPRPTYQDAAGTTPNTNPIILDARGEAMVFWSGSYKVVLKDSSDVTIWTVDNADSSFGLTSSIGSSLVGFIQSGAGAVARTVQDKVREIEKSPMDFGAVGDGVTDDSAAVQRAFNASTYVKFPPLPFYLASPVTPQGNATILGSRGTSIILKDGDTTGFDLTGLTGVTIKGFKFSCAALTGTLGGTNGKAAVYLYNSAQCTIEDNFFFNIYNAGIRLYDSSNNKIRGNYFGDWFTTGTANDDAANIYLMGASSYNLIDGNFCLGANAGTGITISDYYLVGKQPTGNIVTNNRVDNKKAYGILLYTTLTGSPTGYDCKTIISNNTVSNIYGTYVAGNSGAGIYLQGAGGAVCSNNTVYNCCISTTIFGTLAMACITANIANVADTAPILVSNNKVHSMRGPGIWATSSTLFGITIDSNDIRCEQASGGDNNAIVVSACDFTKVTNNTISQVAGTAMYIWTSGTGAGFNRNITISNNVVKTGGTGLFITQIGSGYLTDLVVNNNSFFTGDIGFNLSSIQKMQMVGNSVTSVLYPIFMSGCTYVKASANMFEATNTGSGIDLIGGVNTGTIFDETNAFIGGLMQNGGTAAVITQFSTAAPAKSGTWAVGDRVIQLTPVVGNPKGWRCTVAGNPGTWVSEGAL